MEAIFARPPTSADVFELANVHAGDGARDHQLLDLLGALEDVVDPERAFADVRKRALTRNDVPERSGEIRGRSPYCRDESRDGPPERRTQTPSDRAFRRYPGESGPLDLDDGSRTGRRSVRAALNPRVDRQLT